MQFDKDMNSSFASLFLDIRDLIKKEIGDDVLEKYSENITSFFSKEGGFCYIRTYETYVHIGWFRGVNFEDKYKLLSGNGKTIRAHKLTKLDKKNKEAINSFIEQTKIFLIEHNELSKMKKKK